MEAIALKSGAEFLDVATGPGYVAAEALRCGAKPIGVDFSPDMIADARQRFPQLTIEQGDAENLRFADGSFDTVVAAGAKAIEEHGGRIPCPILMTSGTKKRG